MTDHPLLFRLRGVPAGSAVERVLLAGDRARAAQGEEIPALIWDAEPPALEEFAAQEGRHFNWIPGSDAAAMNGRFFRSLQAARVQAERTAHLAAPR
jgi:hypothetical protein